MKAWTRWCSRYLRMEAKERDLSRVGRHLCIASTTRRTKVTIGIVGKYVEYEDSYKSLKEALVHGALAHNLKLQSELDGSRRTGERDGNRDYEASLRVSTESWCRAALASAALKAC